MFPGDALPLILFLFLLQHQLDEKLLQLFITVVDAELFKATEQEKHRRMNVMLQMQPHALIIIYRDEIISVTTKTFFLKSSIWTQDADV